MVLWQRLLDLMLGTSAPVLISNDGHAQSAAFLIPSTGGCSTSDIMHLHVALLNLYT